MRCADERDQGWDSRASRQSGQLPASIQRSDCDHAAWGHGALFIPARRKRSESDVVKRPEEFSHLRPAHPGYSGVLCASAYAIDERVLQIFVAKHLPPQSAFRMYRWLMAKVLRRALIIGLSIGLTKMDGILWMEMAAFFKRLVDLGIARARDDWSRRSTLSPTSTSRSPATWPR